MNKEDLIERIAKDTGLTKLKASIALDSVVEGITQASERETASAYLALVLSR